MNALSQTLGKYCSSYEAFEYWKLLSFQDAPTIPGILQEWVSHLSDYKIFVKMMDCLYLSYLYLITLFASIMASLTFATINVDGMRGLVKRAYICQHVSNGFDIIARQETHCTNPVMHAWVDQCEGLGEWNCGVQSLQGLPSFLTPA